MDKSTVETALTHAEKWPMTIGFFLAVALMAALAYWLLFKFWPAWLLEQEKHREHLAKALAQRGAEAQEDIVAAAKLSDAQHSALVKELGGRLDKTHDKVTDVHEVVIKLAQKLGAVMILIGLCAGGFIAGFGSAKFVHRIAEARARCSRPCATGWFCCGEDKCCEEKTAPASSVPHSSLAFVSFTTLAISHCRPRVETCSL